MGVCRCHNDTSSATSQLQHAWQQFSLPLPCLQRFTDAVFASCIRWPLHVAVLAGQAGCTMWGMLARGLFWPVGAFTNDSSATAADFWLLKQQSSSVSPMMSTTPPADIAQPIITCRAHSMNMPTDTRLPRLLFGVGVVVQSLRADVAMPTGLAAGHLLQADLLPCYHSVQSVPGPAVHCF